MKNRLTIFLMFLSMILTVSCGKDYNALFQERITELNKEGKYILNQYNDSVGKEHYIVYIDVDKIVIDTLGDSLQVYPLGKVETYQYLPDVDFNDGKFSLKRYNSTDFSIKADTAKKQITVSDGSFLSYRGKYKILRTESLQKRLCAYSYNSANSHCFFEQENGDLYWQSCRYSRGRARFCFGLCRTMSRLFERYARRFTCRIGF